MLTIAGVRVEAIVRIDLERNKVSNAASPHATSYAFFAFLSCDSSFFRFTHHSITKISVLR